MNNLPATIKQPTLPLFDPEGVDDVKSAEDALLKAADDLRAARAALKPQRPWRASDNLDADEVAFIDALDRLDEIEGR